MYIATHYDLLIKNFVIHTFYGEETCFCWNGDTVVLFPYKNDNSVPVKVLTAPTAIKTIQCFGGRIFLTCVPQGIYKLSRDLKFAVLSKSAIAIGSVFYEVLTPRNKYLYLDNKQKMRNKMLFQLSSAKIDSSQLCVYPLNVKNVTQCFIKSIINDDLNVENLCIIAEENKVVTLINETVQIIYNSVYCIKDILSIQKGTEIDGLCFLTNKNVAIIMYSRDNKLVFENIYLETAIQAICIGFSELCKDTLWIVYSDKSKVYYAKKELLTNYIKCMKVEDKNFTCLQLYNSNIILCLTANKELIELPINSVEMTLSLENDTFINILPDVLKGKELIMDNILKATQELQALNEVLMTEEDTLKRINLCVYNQKIRHYPNVSTHRIANQLFLSTNFQDMLPKNSWVIFNVKLDCQNIFYMKHITDQESIVDVYIPKEKTANFSQITIDLVAFKDKTYPWCLIRNYIINRTSEKVKKKKRILDKTDFIYSRIAMLQNFIQKGSIDIKKLSEIKRRLRKELDDV